jgi:hypothetical protein
MPPTYRKALPNNAIGANYECHLPTRARGRRGGNAGTDETFIGSFFG